MWIFTTSSWSPRVLSIVRIVFGFVFMMAGTTKLFGFPAADPSMTAAAAGSLPWVAGVLETFGGAAIILGLLTRPIAFLLAGEMAVAYFMVHAPQSFFPTLNEGVAAVLYCFFFLYLSFAGAGEWSVDAALARRGPPRGRREVEPEGRLATAR